MRNWTQEDARMLGEIICIFSDKVHYWKDRALRAETAERMFATEVYAASAIPSRQGQDAKQGLAGTEGSATAKPGRPTSIGQEER